MGVSAFSTPVISVYFALGNNRAPSFLVAQCTLLFRGNKKFTTVAWLYRRKVVRFELARNSLISSRIVCRPLFSETNRSTLGVASLFVEGIIIISAEKSWIGREWKKHFERPYDAESRKSRSSVSATRAGKTERHYSLGREIREKLKHGSVCTNTHGCVSAQPRAFE